MASNSELRADTVNAIKSRIDATREERAVARKKIAHGQWKAVEPDRTRAAAFDARTDLAAGPGEAARGTIDYQPVAFLTRGAQVRRAVARVALETNAESTTGTGFLISPELFITNQHVIRDEVAAAAARIIFDYEADEGGLPRKTSVFRLAPEVFFLPSDENDLDFALIAVGERVQGAGSLAEFGYCPLSFTPDRHRLGMNVNIIQHPNGQLKCVVLRNNLLVARSDVPGRLLYETDTDEGSSGALVCNDQWDVIALHHYREASQGVVLPDGVDRTSVNEGIRISSIHARLTQALPTLDDAQRPMLQRALSLWKEDAPTERRLERRPEPPSVGPEAATQPVNRRNEETKGKLVMSDSQSVKLIVPIEITVRLAPQEELGAPKAERKELRRQRELSESSRLDRDYANRNGFDDEFVPGVRIKLEKITEPLSKQIAPLREEEKKRAPGELRYQNFSVILSKTRRIALLTATNIDGPTYVSINRDSGQPNAEQPGEGETWYKDTRISDAYFIGQEFYDEWSHIFDRGHLTRRNDPTWGENASRANADTFHFTNCSPQHWKFNQSIKVWQGIERYVLEKGLWETGLNKKLSVLQGPLFEGQDWADDIRIPSGFWKIVVWKGAGGLKAVALVADQSSLFSLTRQFIGKPPAADTPVDVSEFRATVAEIARRTGLDFSAIEPYDTAAGDLPTVGEARQILRSLDQITLS